MFDNIDSPFCLNVWKHHFKEICKRIVKCGQAGVDDILINLHSIGNNILDLYTGRLNSLDIYHEINEFLMLHKLNDSEHFKEWLTLRQGYVIVFLSDNSSWVLRYGKEKRQYVHLHPARNGDFTMRVNGNTLKSAIAVTLLSQYCNQDACSLSFVNKVRMEKLRLSPVFQLETSPGLKSMIDLFLSCCRESGIAGSIEPILK